MAFKIVNGSTIHAQKYTVLRLCPEVRGPDGALLHSVLEQCASRNLHVKVSIKELEQAVKDFDEVLAFEFTLNGQLVCKVEVVK